MKIRGWRVQPDLCRQIWLNKNNVVEVNLDSQGQKTGRRLIQNRPESRHRKTTKDLTFPHIVKVNLLSESHFIFQDFTAHVSSVQASPHSCWMCCYNLQGVRINSLWLEDPSVGSLKAESFLQGFQKELERWPKVHVISPKPVFTTALLLV